MNLKLKVSAISLMVALCFVLGAFDMNDVQERKIAQPGESTKSKSIDYHIMVQRATQVAILALPAAGITDFKKATIRDLGGTINNIVY